jgi:hypothetical protein
MRNFCIRIMKFKLYEMGKACNMHGRNTQSVENLSQYLQGKGTLEDLSIDGTIIFK